MWVRKRARCQRFFAPVEVEPGLAHRDHPRARGDFGDFVHVRLTVVRILGVHGPGAEEKPFVLREQGGQLREVLVIAGDRDGGGHPGRLHAEDDLVAVLVELRRGEVAVGQRGAGSATEFAVVEAAGAVGGITTGAAMPLPSAAPPRRFWNAQ